MDEKDMKDIFNSKLKDIAEGRETTSFIFERKDKSLHGFRVPTNKIELCDFNPINKESSQSGDSE